MFYGTFIGYGHKLSNCLLYCLYCLAIFQQQQNPQDIPNISCWMNETKEKFENEIVLFYF